MSLHCVDDATRLQILLVPNIALSLKNEISEKKMKENTRSRFMDMTKVYSAYDSYLEDHVVPP